MSEIWQNSYSGFSRSACRDWTGWMMEAASRVLPMPEISPTCKRDGHKWSEPLSGTLAETVGCVRCARRGLVVLETRG